MSAQEYSRSIGKDYHKGRMLLREQIARTFFRPDPPTVTEVREALKLAEQLPTISFHPFFHKRIPPLG